MPQPSNEQASSTVLYRMQDVPREDGGTAVGYAPANPPIKEAQPKVDTSVGPAPRKPAALASRSRTRTFGKAKAKAPSAAVAEVAPDAPTEVIPVDGEPETDPDVDASPGTVAGPPPEPPDPASVALEAVTPDAVAPKPIVPSASQPLDPADFEPPTKIDPPGPDSFPSPMSMNAVAPARDRKPAAPQWPAPVTDVPTSSTAVKAMQQHMLAAQAPGACAVHLGKYLQAAAAPREIFVADGESFELGRKPGSPFADDPFVERYHGALVPQADGIRIRDFGSVNGVFVRITTPARLRHRDQFRMGEELLAYEEITERPEYDDDVRPIGCPDPGYWSRIHVLLTPNEVAAAYPVDEDEVVFGREDGHILFPDDTYVSRQHCRLAVDSEGPILDDMSSANGTFLRVRTGDVVPYGSVLLIGQTLMRFDRA